MICKVTKLASSLHTPMLVCLMLTTIVTAAPLQIKLAQHPSLSPDGSKLTFAWRGDIWIVSSKGGHASQLTRHKAMDDSPLFSHDGKKIAFSSNRRNGNQVYVMDAVGGTPQQLTFHTSGAEPQQWYPDDNSLLISAVRDYFWRDGQRFFKISANERSSEKLLFNAAAKNGSLSPDGKRILFTREGVAEWRKGYHGSQASQIWMYEFKTKQFTKILDHETGCRNPIFTPDGKGFYYVGAQSGSFNLRQFDLETKSDRQLTHFEDDSVVQPCMSHDGSLIVFRHLFDLYRFEPQSNHPPVRLEITDTGDSVVDPFMRQTLDSAEGFDVTADGLEIAFISGGDVWVMDTELREPKQVTNTPEQEHSVRFSPKADKLYFISDQKGQSDIWNAERSEPNLYWWQNENFKLEQLTNDADVESSLKFSPDGKHFSYIKGLGDLYIMEIETGNTKRFLESWDAPDYDWSPDGKWIVYAVNDDNFNRDIWIKSVDHPRKSVNISRHPYDEWNPVWRPDGKVIAFMGSRLDRETDIFYVWLTKEDYEQSKRDRTLDKAIEKMKKGRKQEDPKSQTDKAEEKSDPNEESKNNDPNKPDKKQDKDQKNEKKLPEVKIDFARIHERVKQIRIADSTEYSLFWSHDSKKLAFTGTIAGKTGTYTIEIPDNLTPKLLTTKTGSSATWLSKGNQIFWLSNNKLTSISASGSETTYPFNAKQIVDRKSKYRAAFDLAWRTMRDRYYDDRLGNRNWDEIRRKYIDMAADSVDIQSFATIVNMMLGELNGSHLGFYPNDRPFEPTRQDWPITTAHLGLRFQEKYKGPGLKVRNVLPKSPAAMNKSRIKPGDIIKSIDGVTVDTAMDLTTVLNGPLDRDIKLSVQTPGREPRQVTLRPISYGAANTLLYEHWIRSNQRRVRKASNNKLGYVHIQGMNWPSFQKLERELYAVGAGKDGLIIDVRKNGGGFTTDHLLTMLTQPDHAITVPREGGPGYPEDRRVYATWNKPIVVMCDQNSYSNAEIFSHAIKNLKRGRLVGVPTAGAVISTGGTSIMDVGFLRIPFRGWFLLETGRDMELNGAVPDYILWNKPGTLPTGKDAQLDKAIEVLKEDVKKYKSRKQPKLRKATEIND